MAAFLWAVSSPAAISASSPAIVAAASRSISLAKRAWSIQSARAALAAAAARIAALLRREALQELERRDDPLRGRRGKRGRCRPSAWRKA